MSDYTLWQAKIAAYIHDPASKALILMRGISHEKGSVAELRKTIFQTDEAVANLKEMEPIVKQADHWSSAADRPQLPMSLRTKVVFARKPALIHPLTGGYFPIQGFADQDDAAPKAIEALNFDHFQKLVVRNGNDIDWRKTFLSFWRFGREVPAPELGVLWGELPADTRSPDHSIWEHLGLASAFVGSLTADDKQNPALLLVSFGPVQGFIAQARSVSDLWAGSHLLSTIAWQGMRIVCEKYGPDAILFPNLHGVPLVDTWLETDMGIQWPNGLSRPSLASDAHPLFAAAIPNRFVALVPETAVSELAENIAEGVRSWCRKRADELLSELDLAESTVAREQIDRQFKEFPAVNWAMVPWRLGGTKSLDDSQLQEALAILGRDEPYLDKVLDAIVRKEIVLDKEPFYTPNPGVAYPGLYEALERLHAAAKAVRPFDGQAEQGFRCSICGEREWLTNNQDLLKLAARKRKDADTPWNRAATTESIVKKGEHLCGRCALKRFWPRLFLRWAREHSPDLEQDGKTIHRYVVSTHTMALATSVWNWLKEQPDEKQQDARDKLEDEMNSRGTLGTVALPRKLYWALNSPSNRKHLDFFRRLPCFLDDLKDADEKKEDRSRYEAIQQQLERLFGCRPEAYYGFVLMDGDKMGKWLAGEKSHLTMGSRFHEKVEEELRSKGLADYLDARRPTSPAWHQAISSALNNFALHLARSVVEDLFMGKLIYAGGDDLLAMVAVHDLPGMMLALRCTYSGILPWQDEKEDPWEWLTGQTLPPGFLLRLKNGFAMLSRGAKKKKLLRMMGEEATASMGAVIAHHKAPLSRVLGLLRAMEKHAKDKCDRDAFSLALVKRSGGEIRFSGKWWFEDQDIHRGDMGLLLRTRNLFAHEALSRRAAYILIETLRDLPPAEDALAAVITRQLRQQGADKGMIEELAKELAADLATAAIRHHAEAAEREWAGPNVWLRNVFITAEFLARNGRSPIANINEEEHHA